MTTKTFISIDVVCEAAKARGFEVRRFVGGAGTLGAEIWFPNNNGPRAIWNDGCMYGTADALIDDGYGIGYGYNGFFHGCRHHGHERRDAFGMQKLLTHPAFADFTI